MNYNVICKTPAGSNEVRSALWEGRSCPYKYYLIIDSWQFEIDPGSDDQWLQDLLLQMEDRIDAVYPNLGFNDGRFDFSI